MRVSGFVRSGQLADVSQCDPQQPVLATGHLTDHGRADDLSWGVPRQIERLLGRVGLIVLRKAFGIILLAISVKLFTGNITYLFPQGN